jgi:hypothetical protein
VVACRHGSAERSWSPILSAFSSGDLANCTPFPSLGQIKNVTRYIGGLRLAFSHYAAVTIRVPVNIRRASNSLAPIDSFLAIRISNGAKIRLISSHQFVTALDPYMIPLAIMPIVE